MMKKLYYAYVVIDLVGRFEKKLADKDVEIIDKFYAESEKGEPIIGYILKADEGIINPKWKIG